MGKRASWHVHVEDKNNKNPEKSSKKMSITQRLWQLSLRKHRNSSTKSAKSTKSIPATVKSGPTPVPNKEPLLERFVNRLVHKWQQRKIGKIPLLRADNITDGDIELIHQCWRALTVTQDYGSAAGDDKMLWCFRQQVLTRLHAINANVAKIVTQNVAANRGHYSDGSTIADELIDSMALSACNTRSLTSYVAPKLRDLGQAHSQCLTESKPKTSIDYNLVLTTVAQAITETLDNALLPYDSGIERECMRAWHKLLHFHVTNLLFGYNLHRFDQCARTATRVTEITLRYRRLSIAVQ